MTKILCCLLRFSSESVYNPGHSGFVFFLQTKNFCRAFYTMDKKGQMMRFRTFYKPAKGLFLK